MLTLYSINQMSENDQPLVSVIIPNYNHTRFIPTAIRSVLAQHYPHYEIIVVDDGSTDDSREVVAQFGEQVRYIWQKNQGLAGARNTGIQAATGELIGLLDADDEWSPEFLEEMVRLAGEHPDGLAFYSMAQCMDVDGNDLPQLVGGPPVESDRLYQKLLRANFIIPSTVLIRRNTLLDAGLFDANLKFCEDWDLWLRILPTGRIVGSTKCLARYRVHGQSLSTNVTGNQVGSDIVIRKHFGADEGEPSEWSNEKRRAYGGVYRYKAITCIQRQGNWNAAVNPLYRALQCDPTLALDLDFFYELGLGNQQVGYRGVSEVQNQEANALELEKSLQALPHAADMRFLRAQAIGTAEYALGLIAYGFGRRSASRKYFVRALLHRRELILNMRLVSNYLKSFIHRERVDWLKRLLRRTL